MQIILFYFRNMQISSLFVHTCVSLGYVVCKIKLMSLIELNYIKGSFHIISLNIHIVMLLI